MSQSKNNPIADMAREARLELMFPTPVLQYVLRNTGSLNDHLRMIILERERSQASQHKSNQGGWQSTGDFFRWGDKAIAQLATYISKVLRIATSQLPLPGGYRYEFDFYGWAAVNRNGDYNISHVHPMGTWSGIYYVDPGDADAERPSGMLDLSNPNNAAVMTFFPGFLPSEKQIQPEAGMIVLFPSFLQHSVRKYTGQKPRVCIPFNAHLKVSEQD